MTEGDGNRPPIWHAVPVAALHSIGLARLAPAHRPLWLALRLLHSCHGSGAVLPPELADPRMLAATAGALLADVDIGAALDAMEDIGLIARSADGLALRDWDDRVEFAKCSSCKSRNPNPRHTRCPDCCAKDKRSRGGPADSARNARAERKAVSEHCVTPDAATSARNTRGRGADAARNARGSGAANREDPSPQPPQLPEQIHQSPAEGESRESEAEPPPAAQQQQQQPTTGDVIWECGAFAVEMHSGEHPVEKMNPDVHASDVMRLMERWPGGAVPSDVRSPEALQRARRELAKRAIRFCPVPERLARWLAVAYREYRVENLGAYLHKACERGDPGTLLNQHGDGAGCFHPEHEAALQGRHAADVTALVEAGRGKLAAEPKEVTPA